MNWLINKMIPHINYRIKFKQPVVIYPIYNAQPKQLIQIKKRPKSLTLIDEPLKIMNEHNALSTVPELALTERRKHAQTINTVPLEKAIGAVVLKGARRASEKSY